MMDCLRYQGISPGERGRVQYVSWPSMSMARHRQGWSTGHSARISSMASVRWASSEDMRHESAALNTSSMAYRWQDSCIADEANCLLVVQAVHGIAVALLSRK
jgi:hypothetical protein